VSQNRPGLSQLKALQQNVSVCMVCIYFREKDLEKMEKKVLSRMESSEKVISRLESHMCRLMYHLETKMSLGDQEPSTKTLCKR